MAKPGRRPKPTQLKLLEGNAGKRPLNQQEPVFEVRELRPPNGVLSKYGRNLWKQLEPILREAGILTEGDAAAFLMLCQHYGYAVEAGKAAIDRETGMMAFTVESARSGPKKNPLMQVFKENSQMFRMYAEQFGLTPSARSRLNIPEPEEESLAELLFNMINQANQEDEDDN